MTISIQRAKDVMAQFGRQRILVVGDLMLDRYIYGNVNRISPEAPVPVVHVTHEKSMPGGATNVAWNIRALGAGAVVGGLMGKDAAGAELRTVLEREGVSVEAGVEDAKTQTIVKTRIIAERQQVVRVDWEGLEDMPAALVDEFCRRLDTATRKSTGVILEDYGKGVIRQQVVDVVLKAGAAAGIPVGLDPKDNHELVVRGITVGTPNRKEAFTMAGVKESPACANPLEDRALRKVSDILLEKWQPRMLMITLGSQGMLLAAKDVAPRHVPTRAREVFDVSGAGDTVIATCVLALAAGASPIEAAELANYAAGVVVGKIGTASCTQDELIAHMERSAGAVAG